MKKAIPFEFVLEKLDRLNPVTRPMFGCYSVYIGNKIVLMLRKKEEGDKDNGVWIAIASPHLQSLKKEFPHMRSISLFGKKETAWQLLPEEADDFEESVMKACDFILRSDERIGKIPKQKKKKGSKK